MSEQKNKSLFRKILVASDLSDATDEVITCLPGLQRLGTEKVILCHALGIRHLNVMRYELARLIEPRLEAQKAKLESEGFEVEVQVAPGLAPLEVNRVAAEQHASLIVIGSHGTTLAREILLGSVAVQLLHYARLPVLVFRVRRFDRGSAPRHAEACPKFINHVLYPTDFSDTAVRAFVYVQALVDAGTKKVSLLHVQDQAHLGKHLSERLEEFNQIDRDRLERLKTSLEVRGADDVRVEIPYGSPVQEIANRSQGPEDTLVVMGSQGRGFIADVFLGSVSHQVVRQAMQPVLLIPARR